MTPVGYLKVKKKEESKTNVQEKPSALPGVGVGVVCRCGRKMRVYRGSGGALVLPLRRLA
jgi:hypothetical protein